MTGAELIRAERQRQVDEGRTADHDDQHVRGELLETAIAYAKSAQLRRLGLGLGHIAWALPLGFFAGTRWPWAAEDFKPSEDAVQDLVRAGALIAAEIDRLQRQEARRG